MFKEVEVIQVIRTNLKRRGKGIENDPIRIVEQYWNMEGKLLFEIDEWENEKSKIVPGEDMGKSKYNLL